MCYQIKMDLNELFHNCQVRCCVITNDIRFKTHLKIVKMKRAQFT